MEDITQVLTVLLNYWDDLNVNLCEKLCPIPKNVNHNKHTSDWEMHLANAKKKRRNKKKNR